MKRILLIYPKLGFAGSVLVRHPPLSLLYAGIDSLKNGFTIDILDLRLVSSSWQEAVAAKMTPDTMIVGISVMTGPPITNALQVSHWVKKEYPGMTIVWGGPHATFNGAEILAEPTVDYAVAGYGSLSLAELACRLRGDAGAKPFSAIAGLIYRDGGAVHLIPPDNRFEYVDYRDIPYHLVETDLHKYGQLETSDRIFSIYSAMGCPYQCTFCSSPAQYRNIRRKYVTLSPKEVVDHVEFLKNRYGATYIYFIDDDSFVRLDHVEEIIDEINRRGIVITLGFRGARINEIKKMSDEFLTKLARAGTNIMHIGAESGSSRMLKLMKKNCTVQDIVEVNRKMALHPEIKTAYNWVVGLPGESVEDLRLTSNLMLQLANENPSALIFMPNKFRPLPSTELYFEALRLGYKRPQRLEDWAEMEAEGDYHPPWYTREFADMVNMMQITSFFIDGKLFKVKTGNTPLFRLLRLAALFYAPVARFRLRRGITALPLEYTVFHAFTSKFRNLM